MSADYDPFDLEREETAEAKSKDDAKQENLGEVGDIIWLMKGKRGRRIVHRLLDQAGVYRLSLLDGGSELTHLTAFNEGQRNGGLRLMALLTVHCADDYALMLKEKANG